MNIREFYTSQGWKVTSPYGERVHPITGEKSFHYGIDFGGKPRGAPVTTPYGGEVVGAQFIASRGNTVVIRIAKGILQLIQHLDSMSVKVGQRVQAWDIIGTNGSTGDTTGPHIHYELRQDIPTLSGNPIGRYVWGNPDNYKVPIQPKEDPAPEPTPQPEPVPEPKLPFIIRLLQGIIDLMKRILQGLFER
jgi:murein DD-endopeptidase MepM/ murein hydrolase activator NlpD